MLDNASVHHNADIEELADDLDIRLVWNKQDCPDYAPIETTFALVKLQYKKIKLHKLATG